MKKKRYIIPRAKQVVIAGPALLTNSNQQPESMETGEEETGTAESKGFNWDFDF